MKFSNSQISKLGLMAVVITLFFTPCQKDQSEADVVIADSEVSMRSSQDACFNIINNPNFSQGTPGKDAIIIDIDDWDTYNYKL